MVRELHAAGIEVILDVVYNHTCEGGPDGPSLSFRGLGERDFYKLAPHSGHYVDTTGCGNTLDVGDLDVLRLVMDSLRYWVTEMHVDGFRFDLATALTRERMDFDERSPFLAAVHQDPVLRQVKLIAEPWDLGPGGYRLGQFGSPWAEWNDAYRDDVRRFWRGGPSPKEAPADLGWRLTGSQDVFSRPHARGVGQLPHRARRLHDCATSSRTTASTTRPTARTTATAPTTTRRGTTASRARPRTARSTSPACAPGGR